MESKFKSFEQKVFCFAYIPEQTTKKQRFHRKSSGKWKYLRWHTNVWSTLQQPKHLRMSQTGLEHLWEEAGFNGIWKWHYSEMIAEAEKIIITFEKFSSSRLPVLGSTLIWSHLLNPKIFLFFLILVVPTFINLPFRIFSHIIKNRVWKKLAPFAHGDIRGKNNQNNQKQIILLKISLVEQQPVSTVTLKMVHLVVF